MEKILSPTCNECGAPLSVTVESGAAYSEVVEAVQRKANQIADDVETIKLQNELERLDREWTDDRQRYMSANKDGSYSVPSLAGSLVAIAIAVAFGIFWMAPASSMGGGVFLLFGLLFIGVGVFTGISRTKKASEYQNARDRYEIRRVGVVRELDERGSG